MPEADALPSRTASVRFHIVMADEGSKALIGYSPDGGQSLSLCCSTTLIRTGICKSGSELGDVIFRGTESDGSGGSPVITSFTISPSADAVSGEATRRVSLAGMSECTHAY